LVPNLPAAEKGGPHSKPLREAQKIFWSMGAKTSAPFFASGEFLFLGTKNVSLSRALCFGGDSYGCALCCKRGSLRACVGTRPERRGFLGVAAEAAYPFTSNGSPAYGSQTERNLG
jgi:hypothetical protein